MKILMVLTSHSEPGDTGQKKGFWIEEFLAPYYIFEDAGAEITIASPTGGTPPIYSRSELSEVQTTATRRFAKDKDLKDKMAHSVKLETVGQINFDAVFYSGGHGPLWDLVNDMASIALIQNFIKHNKPTAFVSYAPGVLIKVKVQNGDLLIKGKNVTGFSDTEQAALKLSGVVPFLLEDELKKSGANYNKGSDGVSNVVKDGLLITGQNPASSEDVAKLLLKTIRELKAIK
ncbi:putative intracellular protease/amidase [Pedobacter sp. UYEF25]